MAASALFVVAGRPVSPCPAIQKDSGFALDTPLEGNNWSELVAVEGKGNPSMGDNSSWDRVRSNYMHVIGQQIVRGRNSKAATQVDIWWPSSTRSSRSGSSKTKTRLANTSGSILRNFYAD